MAQMWITMGPQHPMTHGLWTLRVKVDGETVVDTEAELGYIHRGVEKICEARDFTQVTPYCDRLCYVSAMTWSNSYIYAAEDLHPKVLLVFVLFQVSNSLQYLVNVIL